MLYSVVLAVGLTTCAVYADTVSVTGPGQVTITQPSVILTQAQFQRVVSDKQQLKTDSTIVEQQRLYINNMLQKDSLRVQNLYLQDTILNKYKSLYVAASTREAKLESPGILDSKLLWLLIGFFGSFLISMEAAAYK